MTMEEFFENSQIEADQLIHFLNAFREIRPDLSVGTLFTLLTIAKRGAEHPMTIGELAKSTGLEYPTIARHCDILSDSTRTKKSLGFIQKTDGAVPRTKLLSISDKGREFFENVIAEITYQNTPGL